MDKTRFRLKINPGFLIGLLAGVVLGAIGIVLYLRLSPADVKNPPVNSADTVIDKQCSGRCRSKYGYGTSDTAACKEKCTACWKACDDVYAACKAPCRPGVNDCSRPCSETQSDCIMACIDNL